jgi:hypothetical protein
MLGTPKSAVEVWRKEWPPAFAGVRIDELSGRAIRWSTTQNRRSRREIPTECFDARSRPIVVLRDPFLNWYEGRLKGHRPRQGPKPPTRRPRARAAE